jgi:hypothetical protein
VCGFLEETSVSFFLCFFFLAKKGGEVSAMFAYVGEIFQTTSGNYEWVSAAAATKGDKVCCMGESGGDFLKKQNPPLRQRL